VRRTYRVCYSVTRTSFQYYVSLYSFWCARGNGNLLVQIRPIWKNGSRESGYLPSPPMSWRQTCFRMSLNLSQTGLFRVGCFFPRDLGNVRLIWISVARRVTPLNDRIVFVENELISVGFFHKETLMKISWILLLVVRVTAIWLSKRRSPFHVSKCLWKTNSVVMPRCEVELGSGWHATGWRRPKGNIIFIGHFSQKSSIICGSFAENDLQLRASYGSGSYHNQGVYATLLRWLLHTKRFGYLSLNFTHVLKVQIYVLRGLARDWVQRECCTKGCLSGKETIEQGVSCVHVSLVFAAWRYTKFSL